MLVVFFCNPLFSFNIMLLKFIFVAPSHSFSSVFYCWYEYRHIFTNSLILKYSDCLEFSSQQTVLYQRFLYLPPIYVWTSLGCTAGSLCLVYFNFSACCQIVHKRFVLLFFLTFKKTFYWNIVDLQCRVSFRCTAKWFSYTHIYTHILTFSFIFFSIMVYHRILNIVPCAIQYDLVVYPFYI